MRIAYIILAHKLPEQLVRLVRRLQDDTASFFIHVDKHTDAATHERMAEPLRAYANVYFVHRHPCGWGAFGHVKATLDGIHQAFASGVLFDYVALLTGQDYPLKSPAHLQQALADGNGHSFLEYFPLPSPRWKHENGGLDRLTYWYFHVGGRSVALMKRNPFKSAPLRHLWSRVAALPPIHRRPPPGWTLYGGSAYWFLTRECAQYVNDFVQRHHAFVRFFRHALISNEIFFQTIILNSPLKERVINENVWHIAWSTLRHPPILRQDDFEQMVTSDKLFARKFDGTIDAAILDMIDRAMA